MLSGKFTQCLQINNVLFITDQIRLVELLQFFTLVKQSEGETKKGTCNSRCKCLELNWLGYLDSNQE